MYIKKITEIEKSEIRLKLQSWLINNNFAIYKSSKRDLEKNKISFESGLPFKKDGKIIWFTDKLVALYSYHYDMYGFEQEAIIVNEPQDLNDYLTILKIFEIIHEDVSKKDQVDKLYFDKIIPAEIQGLLLFLGFTVIEISCNKYFYGVSKMQRDSFMITFYTNSISIYEKTEKSKERLMATFCLREVNIKPFFHIFQAIGIINEDEFLLIQHKITTDIST
jgi:hypothetical protein